MCPFKLRNVCNDQSVKFYSFILIFSTLCVVHDLIFPRKLLRRHLPITFVYSVNHASAQALRPITFTQHFKTTRHLFSIQLLWKPKILKNSFQSYANDFWHSAIEQIHMDLRCFWDVGEWNLKIYSRVGGNRWPHWYINYVLTCMLF